MVEHLTLTSAVDRGRRQAACATVTAIDVDVDVGRKVGRAGGKELCVCVGGGRGRGVGRRRFLLKVKSFDLFFL